MGTKNSAVFTANPADILSRKIGVSRETLMTALNSTKAELVNHIQSITFLMGSDKTPDEKPRLSKKKANKKVVKKVVKKAARRKMKPKVEGEISLRKAVSNIVDASATAISVPEIIELLPSQGKDNKGKNISNMVNQSLTKLIRDGSVTRPSRGKYERVTAPVEAAKSDSTPDALLPAF